MRSWSNPFKALSDKVVLAYGDTQAHLIYVMSAAYDLQSAMVAQGDRQSAAIALAVGKLAHYARDDTSQKAMFEAIDVLVQLGLDKCQERHDAAGDGLNRP